MEPTKKDQTKTTLQGLARERKGSHRQGSGPGAAETSEQPGPAADGAAEALERLFASNLAGIILADRGGALTEANDFFLRLLGYRHSDLPLRWEAVVAPGRNGPEPAKTLAIMAATGGDPFDLELMGKDGRCARVRACFAPLGEDGSRYIGLVLDRTGQEQAERQLLEREAQLRALAAALLQAEERERRRVAQGLHDQVGQILALVKGKLGGLQAGGLEQPVAEIQNLVNQAIRTTRTLTFELSSPVLYELGLDAALQSLGEQVAVQHGLRFHFEAGKGPRPLPAEARPVLYRIARELLLNVVKHAHARSVSLAVRRASDCGDCSDRFELSIADDGVGFDAARAGEGFDEHGGFGLFSIRQQLDHLGGRLEIDSAPGGGTRIAVSVPLA